LTALPSSRRGGSEKIFSAQLVLADGRTIAVINHAMANGGLACVATYHAIDRAAHPKAPGNLRKQWCNESSDFLIVDMVAHHFKHVLSDVERHPPEKNIPLSFLVFGAGAQNDEMSLETRNLFFHVRDAIRFLRQKAN
jgi:hypothetical protein